MNINSVCDPFELEILPADVGPPEYPQLVFEDTDVTIIVYEEHIEIDMAGTGATDVMVRRNK